MATSDVAKMVCNGLADAADGYRQLAERLAEGPHPDIFGIAHAVNEARKLGAMARTLQRGMASGGLARMTYTDSVFG